MNEERPGTPLTLPTKGFVYEDKIPRGELTIYPMRTIEEKLLGGSTSRGEAEKVIDLLISRCTSIPTGFAPSTLLLGDRMFLLLRIRAISYGSVYPVRLRCSECSQFFGVDVNLETDLLVRELTEDWEEKMEVTLPTSGDKVRFRFLTGDDTKAIIRFTTQQNKRANNQIGDQSYVFRQAIQITHVEKANGTTLVGDGRDLMGEAMRYVEQMLARDSSYLRQYIDEITPGIDLTINVTCRECGNVFDEGLPLSAEFFRADYRRQSDSSDNGAAAVFS